MSDSILDSTKKALGLGEDYTAFDDQIIVFINGVFSDLYQLGVGPDEGFRITDASTLWSEYLPAHFRLDNVKTYMYMRVRLLFDPPPTSYGITALKEQIEETAVRILMEMERFNWTDPDPDPILDEIIDLGYA